METAKKTFSELIMIHVLQIDKICGTEISKFLDIKSLLSLKRSQQHLFDHTHQKQSTYLILFAVTNKKKTLGQLRTNYKGNLVWSMLGIEQR